MAVRIYADFHKAQRSPWSDLREAVPLVCWGSLVDLSRLRIRLVEGMAVTVFMDSCDREDVAADGIARFHPPSRMWWVEYDPATLYYPPRAHYDPTQLSCWSCGSVHPGVGVQPGERCSACGSLLEAPWAAPE